VGIVLAGSQIEQYERDGYLHPVRVLTTAQAEAVRTHIERYEHDHGGPLAGAVRHKSQLLFADLARVVTLPAITDAVADLYGPDLLCWSTSFFIKEARDPAFVSWHQDATYWGLSRPDVVTAWVALTASTAENGALEVIPGSHRLDQLPHRDTFAPDNLLTRGQEIAVEVDRAQAVTLELQPGEMSLHHVRLVHGSAPNRSDGRRMGFAIRYLPTSVAPVGGVDSAALVRGVDAFHNFEPEPLPTADSDPAFVELHRRLTDRQARALYAGTGRSSFESGR
jgi:non-heme Fe2+,alpha-ketoglutarate-dependent halogenase